MSEWTEKILENLTTKIADRDHFTPTYVDSGIIMISPKDISSDEKIDFSNTRFITKDAHDLNRKKTDLEVGDLVFTRIGALLGKVCIVQDWMPEFSILHSASMIRTNNEIVPDYLLYFIKSYFFQSQIKNEVQSIGVPDLGLDKIKRFKIFYPKNISIQKQIANILITCDSVIEETQATITKYKAIKQGMLHDLFTRGIDIKTGKLRPKYEDAPELYKKSKLGWIPREWEVNESNYLVKFINGRAYSLDEWETTGIPVIRLQNLTGSGDNYYYSNLELPENQYCKRGDLLYMWSATFGPHIWTGEKAIFHYHIWKVECSNKMLPSYFYYELLRFTAIVLDGANGSTMAHITKEGMDKRLTITPPKDEQEDIASILCRIDSQLFSEERYFLKLQSIKQGLMGDLLSGRKSVIADAAVNKDINDDGYSEKM